MGKLDAENSSQRLLSEQPHFQLRLMQALIAGQVVEPISGKAVLG
jgi:hypothetical protein